jgi:hypothetical protein
MSGFYEDARPLRIGSQGTTLRLSQTKVCRKFNNYATVSWYRLTTWNHQPQTAMLGATKGSTAMVERHCRD